MLEARMLARQPLRPLHSGDAVSRDYKSRFPFTGGTIIHVVFDASAEAHAGSVPTRPRD